jgi:lipopolysaccharide biosynthesis glycosyltransferase
MATIHVVFAADDKYVQHMGVTILSILRNIKSNNSVVVNVIDNELSVDSCNILREIVEKNNASISFLHDNSGSVDNLYIWCNNMSKVVYYRLLIPNLVSAEVDKVIYLDSDIIVRHDITNLWNTNISEHYIAAVIDSGFEYFSLKTKIRENLGIPENMPYFNSGVQLINVKKWREDGIVEKTIEFISKNPEKIFFLDQDALNSVLWGKWLPLHPKWNVQEFAFKRYYKWKLRKLLTGDFVEAVENPAIVHFTTGNKPWVRSCTVPFAEEYFENLKMTPWNNFKQSKYNIFIRYTSHKLRSIKNTIYIRFFSKPD